MSRTSIQRPKNSKALPLLKKISPVAWQNIHFHGHYTFCGSRHPINLDAMVANLTLKEGGQGLPALWIRSDSRNVMENCLTEIFTTQNWEALYGFKHPSQNHRESLVKPASKANTKLILAEEDNIQHILASLALKVTRQSVIIAKLSSYPRKNRTKKALWELDNLRRSLHLLNYVDSPQFQRNIQRALNRGESYHKLVRAVAYANGGKLRVRTDQEQQLWSECSRLLTNCIIYYNACILSELLERAERRQDYQPTDAIKRANPASWKHVNLYGAYSFLDIGDGVDLQELVNLLEAARGRDAAAPD